LTTAQQLKKQRHPGGNALECRQETCAHPRGEPFLKSKADQPFSCADTPDPGALFFAIFPALFFTLN